MRVGPDLLVAPERPSRVLRALLRHRPVDLLGAETATLDGLTVHALRPSRGPRRAATFARARVLGVPKPYARRLSPELVRGAERLARAPDRERVIAEGPVAAAALLRLAARQPAIYCAHGLASARRRGGELQARRELRSFERGLLQAYAETWLPSEHELEAADDLYPGARLRLVPAALDVAAIPVVRRAADSSAALFAGDFTREHDRALLRFLIGEVLPAIWPAHPDVTLTVAGRAAGTVAAGDERVRVARDGEPPYAGAGCLVVPDGGAPLRLVEALAHGLPVVAAAGAARGLSARAGEHYLEAPRARVDFAVALVEALKGASAGAIGAAGRALAEREYSIEALAARVAPA